MTSCSLPVILKITFSISAFFFHDKHFYPFKNPTSKYVYIKVFDSLERSNKETLHNY